MYVITGGRDSSARTSAGFAEPPTRLEDGIKLYVQNYLESGDAFC